MEYFCGFVRGVCEKANGMKTYGELLGRMDRPSCIQLFGSE
jgi:hypothetical protein